MIQPSDKTSNTFARHILELRKQRGWSQSQVGVKIGTSAAIVGRYERGDMTPSIDVARNLAHVFGVTLDYLLGDTALPDVLRDKAMLERWAALDALNPDERQRILFVVDGLIRDANARQAYSKTA